MIKYWAFMIGAVLLGSISQMFLKKATFKEYKSPIFEYVNPWTITGYSLLVISTLLVLFAYRGLEFKNGAIIDSLGNVFVLVLSRLIYNERITKNKVIGICLILLGVFVFYI